MAKESIKARERKREHLVEQYKEKRKVLKDCAEKCEAWMVEMMLQIGNELLSVVHNKRECGVGSTRGASQQSRIPIFKVFIRERWRLN